MDAIPIAVSFLGTTRIRLVVKASFEATDVEIDSLGRHIFPCVAPQNQRWRSCFPTVGVADGDHGGQDAVPGLRLGHNLVWEHASVPTDVPALSRELAGFIA